MEKGIQKIHVVALKRKVKDHHASEADDIVAVTQLN
jgi:hypothetical protein